MATVAWSSATLKRVPADPQQQAASYGDPSLSVVPELVQSLTASLARAIKSGGNADPLK